VRHLSIVAKEVNPLRSVLEEFLQGSDNGVAFRGIGHVVDSDNILAVKLLKGNPTTYSADPSAEITDFPENAGPDTSLVSIIQGRSNGRLAFSGSSDMFSNQMIVKYGNRAFCSGLSQWVFGESGVLRFRNVQHFKSDGTPPDVILHEKQRPDLPHTLYPDPEITRNSLVYRIKDEIVYSMVVEEYKNNQWLPFSPNDMQMEFVMLDPHIRKTMTCIDGNCTATFTAPDNYGVFKFRVFYRRPGFSVLHAETQVSIRPFKHNEYERFIYSAFPYYGSAISAVIGFLVLTTSFLFAADKDKQS
jgi:oligosaccharyltransferase complex subunit beta